MNSDKYNKSWVRWFSKGNYTEWAITLGQTTYYSCPESKVGKIWRAHEEIHKRQWRDEGWKFPFKYLWYNFAYGYMHNPYETEATEDSYKQ